MAHIIDFNPSRTLMEFRLLPGLTSNATKGENISLQTPLVYSPQQNKKYYLNIPIVSAAMQSVSGEKMGIELAKLGGTSFIYCSQSIESQTEMIAKVKSHKAGFVVPRTVLAEMFIKELHALKLETGYNIFPVVDHDNRFLGLITRNDYDVSLHGHLRVRDRMIGKDQLVVGTNINSLKTANNILMESHQSLLPILNDTFNLLYLVFRKDINDHLDNPYQAVDEKKRLLSVASINTHDFRERVPVLINAGADALAVDSSDGFTIFQKETLQWITENFPGVPVIGGNVVTAKGFRSLVESGASAVKVGMGSGSICITQEQKGTGRGLATAIIKTVEERNKYFGETEKYIPVVADGGIVNSKDIVIALALGADYVMMGRYFARMEESPTDKITINNRIMKPYWGEGSNRARDWKQQRYHQAKFNEGVEGFVEYAGKLKDNMEITISKIKSTLSTCGVSNIKELHENSELELVSSLSIREGKVHDIFIPENSDYLNDTNY